MKAEKLVAVSGIAILLSIGSAIQIRAWKDQCNFADRYMKVVRETMIRRSVPLQPGCEVLGGEVIKLDGSVFNMPAIEVCTAEVYIP